jgi:hypothetical protein
MAGPSYDIDDVFKTLFWGSGSASTREHVSGEENVAVKKGNDA